MLGLLALIVGLCHLGRPLLPLLGLLRALEVGGQVRFVLSLLHLGLGLLCLRLLDDASLLFLLGFALVLNVREPPVLGGLDQLVVGVGLGDLLFHRVLLRLGGVGEHLGGLAHRELNDLAELVALIVRLEEAAVELRAERGLRLRGAEVACGGAEHDVVNCDC